MIDFQNLQQILNQNDIHVLVTDKALRIVEVSDRFRAYFCLQEDWFERSLMDVAPELIGSEAELSAIQRGELASYCLPMVNRELNDGRLQYVNFTVLPHRGADDTIDGLMYVIEDITAMAEIEQAVTQHRNELSLLQKQLETQNLQLAAANAELRQLDELKSKFVSIAAHDLRSPLSTLGGYLDLLEDSEFGGLSEQQTDFVGVIRRSTNRLLEIIENLLDITRIAAGRMDLVMSITDISELLTAVANDLMPTVKERSLALAIRIDDSLPSVLCDIARTNQVLYNLVLNAVKYTKPGGHIDVSVSMAADPGFVEIAVADNGIGIPLVEQDQIFESFFRASNVYEVDVTGTGLGLNIARSLVELHGGEIRFESIPGEGTTFYVTFPAVHAPSRIDPKQK